MVETHLDISPDAFEVKDETYLGLEANSYKNLQFVRGCLKKVAK